MRWGEFYILKISVFVYDAFAGHGEGVPERRHIVAISVIESVRARRVVLQDKHCRKVKASGICQLVYHREVIVKGYPNGIEISSFFKTADGANRVVQALCLGAEGGYQIRGSVLVVVIFSLGQALSDYSEGAFIYFLI